MFKKKSDSMLAIDLAPDAVRLLDVTFRRGVPHVDTLVSGSVSAGSSDSLPERHLAALETLISSHRIGARQCVATMPTNLVVTRSVTIDSSKQLQPGEQIRQTLQNCLPDSRDLLFDYWPISEKASGRTREVLVVATQGSVVQRYLKGLTRLKLSCVHLDVSPCALASLIARIVPSQEAPVGAIALTDSVGYFTVVEKQRVLFWRPFEFAPGAKAGSQANLARVGDEISKCVSHMVGALHLDGVNEIYAFGEGAFDEHLGPYLLNRFNLQVSTPSPFEALPGDAVPQEMREKLQPVAATQFAATIGLALQSRGGPNHG